MNNKSLYMTCKTAEKIGGLQNVRAVIQGLCDVAESLESNTIAEIEAIVSNIRQFGDNYIRLQEAKKSVQKALFRCKMAKRAEHEYGRQI